MSRQIGIDNEQNDLSYMRPPHQSRHLESVLSNASIDEQELASYRAHVGRRVEEKDSVSPEVVGRFAAALDEDWLGHGAELPPMWHYGLFLNQTPTARLGPDGHPPRGDFMPPVKLPRRMFAGARLSFHAPLVSGQEASKVSEITSVDHRQGKSGTLVFVRVKASVLQRDRLCIEEEQTIVYRGDGPRMPAVMPRTVPPESDNGSIETWIPSSVELFRFSAVMFNAHRIHYDLPYATEVEGYPALVVHGPLTALRLCAFAVRLLGRLKEFQFRGEAPLFVGQPVRLVGKPAEGQCHLAAERCDGATAMTATAVA
jgi:3-methylfumaryl-CoA hydratase